MFRDDAGQPIPRWSRRGSAGRLRSALRRTVASRENGHARVREALRQKFVGGSTRILHFMPPTRSGRAGRRSKPGRDQPNSAPPTGMRGRTSRFTSTIRNSKASRSAKPTGGARPRSPSSNGQTASVPIRSQHGHDSPHSAPDRAGAQPLPSVFLMTPSTDSTDRPVRSAIALMVRHSPSPHSARTLAISGAARFSIRPSPGRRHSWVWPR